LEQGFSIAAQAVGMGIYGILNWVRKDREAIHWRNAVPFGLIGCIGFVLGVWVLHFNAGALRIIFAVFTLLLAIYIVVGVFVFRLDDNQGRLVLVFDPRTWDKVAVRDWAIIFATGLIGGLFVGWFGTGIDVTYFFITTLVYRVNPHPATVTSICLMGCVAWFAFIIRSAQQTVPWADLIMVLPGIILGARVGPVVNMLLGKRAVLVLFAALLVLEFARTMVAVASGQIWVTTNSTLGRAMDIYLQYTI
jgi:uncharacterized membrane protein YfcA